MPNSETGKRAPGREVLEWVISLAVAVGLALAVHAWVGQLVVVEGSSMRPGLRSNERVLVGKVEYYFRQPRLGDIVLTRYPNSDEHFIKRVIGVAGDRIDWVLVRGLRVRTASTLDAPVQGRAVSDHFPVLVELDAVALPPAGGLAETRLRPASLAR